jgi:hypothetical protein
VASDLRPLEVGLTHTHTHTHTEAVKYKANHGAKFVRPACLPLYNKRIADNARTVVRICVEAAHKSQLNDYASYKVAKQGMSNLRKVVTEI